MSEDPVMFGTYSGHILNLRELETNDIRLKDIAHNLAMTCRYTGSCLRFYSVAEHCVRMSFITDTFPHPAELLMHDSAEAYIGDLNPGIKRVFNIRPFEDKILNVIAARFNLWEKGMRHPDLKTVDEKMARAEIRDLLNWKQSQAFYLTMTTKNKPLDEPVEPWHWRHAENMFLARAAALKIKD